MAKSIVEVTWIAPKANISNIQFRATVVRNTSIFWTNIYGPNLTYAGSSASYMMASLCITYISILGSVLSTISS
ncbi:hypothetical protein GDO81_017864 [Engystomops pustulosus]|uniref:Reelin domain-containing protein n=1 Tax=Engystomops pustulosus TaxID=76066 RepID=A0AAV7A9G2_ENGPU|nr:hypothetical protein GDO81_017864 [Engystomops pustulosus]